MPPPTPPSQQNSTQGEPPSPPVPQPAGGHKRRKRRVFTKAVGLTLFAILLGFGLCRVFYPSLVIDWPRGLRWLVPEPLQRPYGMAPAAFAAYMRACDESNTSAGRITQTIGDAVMSVGYHHQDGFVEHQGDRIPYTAAVDIHVFGLDDAGIRSFQKALERNGFVSFYRHEGKWRNNRHIHAIYVMLPMKPQLKRQVTEWLRDRRILKVKPHAWERRIRQSWGLRSA